MTIVCRQEPAVGADILAFIVLFGTQKGEAAKIDSMMATKYPKDLASGLMGFSVARSHEGAVKP